MLKIEENKELFLKVVDIIARSPSKKQALIKRGILTDEECSQVKKIELLTSDNMKGLENLTNLESLKVNHNFRSKLPKLVDYSFLKSMPNLKNLYLLQPNTSHIDLSNNKKLKRIDIFSSRENLLVEGLENIDCFTSNKGRARINIQANIKNLTKLIDASNKKNTKNMTLDLFTLVREMHEHPSLLNLIISKKNNINFSIPMNAHIYTPSEVLTIHNMVSDLKKELKFDQKDTLQKIMSINKWLATQLEFDHETFGRESKGYSKKNDKIRDILPVLKSKKGVCVGYSNIFCYVLQSEGIEAIPVSVISKSEGGHRIARVKDNNNNNNKWLYFDPTASRVMGNLWKYFALSKTQAERYYDMTNEEHIITPEALDRKKLDEKIDELSRIDRGQQINTIIPTSPKNVSTIKR